MADRGTSGRMLTYNEKIRAAVSECLDIADQNSTTTLYDLWNEMAAAFQQEDWPAISDLVTGPIDIQELSDQTFGLVDSNSAFCCSNRHLARPLWASIQERKGQNDI